MTSRSSHRQIVKRRFSRRERATAAREGKKPKHYTPPRKRRVRPRLDPAVLWPTEKEFMARFRFPVERVRQLTEMFRRSRACPSKGDRRGCGIPIFHKVDRFV